MNYTVGDKYNVGDIFVSNFVIDDPTTYVLTLTDEYYGWDKEKRYKLRLLSTNTKSIMVIYTKEDIEFYIEKGKLTHYPVKRDNI
jgi:hypothetical protein